MLDVPTGGFHARFRDGTMASGRFDSAKTQQIRHLAAAGHAIDFADPQCPRIVVSNGGVRTLELRTGERRISAPRSEGCWSAEAEALHGLIERDLYERGEEWRMPLHRDRIGRFQ